MTPLKEIESYFRTYPPTNLKDVVSVTKLVMTLKAHPGDKSYMPQYYELLQIYNRLKP
jgi:hypothetical protein